ncbi:MAG: NAD(P)H-hydrate dehydratase [Anaerolineales bacterium]|nr:NAD(P)H-hydrate dehydratase [Anaerolineales bacterium]
MKLVSVSQMRAIEQEANASGLTYAQMMENAGFNLAREVIRLTEQESMNEYDEIYVLGLVGPGNNGGDTLVALANLAELGLKATACLVNRKSEHDPLIDRLLEKGGEIFSVAWKDGLTQLREHLQTCDILLDGVLGTGAKLPLKEEIASVLEMVRYTLELLDQPPLVVAVDCPSGVDCDTGAVAPQTIPADVTVTMAAVKRGLLALPAYEMVGDLRVVGIGDLTTLSSWREILDEVASGERVAALLPKRKADAHKGTFGTAVVVAGSVNYTGAALLAGKAAYRSGAGLVTLAIPASLHPALAGHLPEATWILLPHELGVIASSAADVLAQSLNRATAMLIGPGFGLEETTREFLERLLMADSVVKVSPRRIGFLREAETKEEPTKLSLPPLVFDADGLKLLAKIEDWAKRLPTPTILTPHPGEMSVLTDLSVEEIQRDRLAIARRFAAEWGHVIVLKGAFTVIAAPDGRTATIPVATPALARAGTGDVLAGLIVGLRAQGMEAYEAALAGAWIHAQAGLAAAHSVGNSASVLAGDVLDAIQQVLGELFAILRHRP